MSSLKYAAAILTDTHGDHNNRELQLSIYQQFFAICQQNGLTRAFHAGDFFIDRKGQGLDTLYLFTEVGRLAKAHGVTLYIIPGNHDKTDQTSHRSYLGIYNHSHIRVMDCRKPSNAYLDDADFGIRYTFLPFFEETIYEQKLTALKRNLHPTYKNVLITHVGLDGVLNNRGEQEERSIPVGKFRGFDLVLIGHYHNLNRISKEVIYIASTHQANYGEDEAKGITLLTPLLKAVQVPLDTPKWLKVRITNPDYTVRALADHYGKYQHLKFEYHCTEEEYQTVDRAHLQRHGVEVGWVNSRTSRLNDDEAEKLAHTAAFTPAEVNKNFLHYCKEQAITPDRRRLGLQLLKTAFQP